MSESPERIWAKPGMPGYITDGPCNVYDIEYVRADMLHEIFLRYSKAETRRIEELEAENENLKANLTHLRQTCQRAWDKCDGERVKLAKAVEALQQLVIEYDEVALAYDEPESMTAAYVVACNTLAELKNPKDSMKGEK